MRAYINQSVIASTFQVNEVSLIKFIRSATISRNICKGDTYWWPYRSRQEIESLYAECGRLR